MLLKYAKSNVSVNSYHVKSVSFFFLGIDDKWILDFMIVKRRLVILFVIYCYD